MAQIKTGTVSVTNGSNVVTGVGTTWLTDGVQAGDGFVIQSSSGIDGAGVYYTVGGSVTETGLQLASNWSGETASGVTYVIAPDFIAPGYPLLLPGDLEAKPLINQNVQKLINDRTSGLAERWISKYTTDQLSTATSLRAGNLVRTPGFVTGTTVGGNDGIVEVRDGSPEAVGSLIFITGTTLQVRMLFPGGIITLDQFNGDKDALATYVTKTIQVAPRDADKQASVIRKIELGDWETPVDNRDNVFYVTGHLVGDAGINAQRELIGYGFRMTTDHPNLEGGDVRGIKGNVIGEGGSANIRAIHALASGDNGHTGDLTGILGVVDHADGTDDEAGAIGTAFAIIGSVGAKCTGAFEARAYAGQQRPSFGYRIRGGTGGNLMPEVACYLAHGGGNGALFRGVESNVDNTVTFDVSNKGAVRAKSYDSGQVTIDDDDFIEIEPPNSSGTIEFFAEATAQSFGKYFYRVSGTALAQTCYEGSIVSAVAGSVPTGTDGADGEITLFTDSASGKVYIENRSGFQRSFVYFFVGRELYK